MDIEKETKKQTILVAGAYGFLGRYTAKAFHESGYHVVGMGHGKWHQQDYSKWGLSNWFETTITFEALLNINMKFDAIVHCGGSGSVGFSYSNPYEDFQKGVQSTLSLLEFIRLRNPKCKFIYSSSPAVQGNLGNIQMKEDMAASPISPYGFHKKIAEDLCLSYHKNYGVKVGIIRFFSIYGEGLKKQLLWDACNKINQFTEVTFFGKGNETRDWLHVSDAACLVEKVARNIKGYEIINGGFGKQTQIKDVVDLLSKYFGKNTLIGFNGQIKEGDPLHFWAENSKALLLGWKPQVDLETGLQRYVEYFKALKND